MGETLGRVETVVGSRVTMRIDPANASMQAIRVGAMVKMPIGLSGEVVGVIREMRAEANAIAHVTAELVGMMESLRESHPRFVLGISRHPTLGAPVLPMTESDLTMIYTQPSVANIRIGALSDDPSDNAIRPSPIAATRCPARTRAPRFLASSTR